MSAQDWIATLLVSAGGVFCVIGAVGLIRMPTFFTRMHAASVIETLGAGLVIAGLMVKAGFSLESGKLAILGLLIFFASPAATHALAKAAWERRREVGREVGIPPGEGS